MLLQSQKPDTPKSKVFASASPVGEVRIAHAKFAHTSAFTASAMMQVSASATQVSLDLTARSRPHAQVTAQARSKVSASPMVSVLASPVGQESVATSPAAHRTARVMVSARMGVAFASLVSAELTALSSASTAALAMVTALMVDADASLVGPAKTAASPHAALAIPLFIPTSTALATVSASARLVVAFANPVTLVRTAHKMMVRVVQVLVVIMVRAAEASAIVTWVGRVLTASM